MRLSPQRLLPPAVLLAGLVAAWLLWPSSPAAGDGGPLSTASAAQASTASAPASSPAGPAQGPVVPEEVLPGSGCWEGLLAFDRGASMSSLREALTQAVEAGDRSLAQYLKEKLTDLIGEDPERALEVVSWALEADGPQLGLYMEALKAAPAVHHARVAERLLALGEDKGATLTHRAAAIDALETQRRLGPAALQRLKAVALDETVDTVAWMAARTIGRVMKEDFERTGTYAPYWGELLSLGEKSADTAVRLLSLEMPSYSDPIIGGESLDRLAGILKKDPERDVREMAAFRLAVTEEPQRALDIYRDAFASERDLCVRWAIFRFAVRAAGTQALPLLERFAAQDPRFREDLADFQRLYAEGTVDFARVWLGKAERHACTFEEGAPHG